MDKFFNEYTQESKNLASNIKTLDKTNMSYLEYERLYNTIKTKLESLRSKLIVWQEAPLDWDDYKKREKLIKDFGDIIKRFKELDSKYFAKQNAKEIGVTGRTWFMDFTITESEIRNIIPERFLAYNKEFDFYLVNISWKKHFLRIDKNNKWSKLAVAHALIKAKDNDWYIEVLQWADLTSNFQGLELHWSKWAKTLFIDRDVTTDVAEKLWLVRKLERIRSWTTTQ